MKDYYLTRANMLSYLDRLPQDEAGAVTIYFPPGLSVEQVRSRLHTGIAGEIPEGMTETVASSPTGTFLFWATIKTLVIPPFPVEDNAIFTGCVIAPLADILRKERLIALVLVRLGSYGVGVYLGESAVTTKVGTGLVHARHRQGGSSAARFRRHREKQIEQFLIRVCEKSREHLSPYLDRLDHAVFGGARTTIELLQKECPLLQRLEDRLLPPLLDIPDPRQAVLEASIRRIYSSRVVEWG